MKVSCMILNERKKVTNTLFSILILLLHFLFFFMLLQYATTTQKMSHLGALQDESLMHDFVREKEATNTLFSI